MSTETFTVVFVVEIVVLRQIFLLVLPITIPLILHTHSFITDVKLLILATDSVVK